MQKMKFCQYCGEKEKLELICQDINRYYIMCGNCGARGPLERHKEMAILKWNSRIQEVPEMPQEKPMIVSVDRYDQFDCPIQGPDRPCNGYWCMMWIRVGEGKGRCGLVNTKYINSTGCGAE